VDAAAVAADATWREADVRRYMAAIPPELLDDVLALRLAWAQSATGEDSAAGIDRQRQLVARIEHQRESRAPLTLAELAVDGRDLQEALGLPEGPRVGALLERLLADVIEEPARNERATLLARAADVLAGERPDRGSSAPRAGSRDGVGSGS
jgi:hypothetical protein